MTERLESVTIETPPEKKATMRAIVQRGYGPPEVLQLAEIGRPLRGEDQILIRVHAAGINFADPKVMRGSPYLFRIMYGLGSPRNTVPGLDLAGTVEAVGSRVTTLQPGDEVFGSTTGAFAEYAVGPAKNFVPKPVNLTFEQAAAVPQTGCVAVQALRDVAKVQPGQTVLINGASGGVGTYAVQVAKAYGAEVTGVCSTDSVEMVNAIGADHVIDYTEDDFTQGTERYDLILDNVENHPQSACRKVLKPTGMLIPNNGESLFRVAAGLALSLFVRPKLRRFLSLTKPEDLLVLKELIEGGKVIPVIDRTFLLADAAEALGYMEQGHAHGKVVITIGA